MLKTFGCPDHTGRGRIIIATETKRLAAQIMGVSRRKPIESHCPEERIITQTSPYEIFIKTNVEFSNFAYRKIKRGLSP